MVLNAELNEYIEDLEGYFGLSNLPHLNKLSKLKNYTKNESTVSVTRKKKKDEEVPISFSFKDKDGNSDTYNLMDQATIDTRLKSKNKFKGADWNVTIKPTLAKIEQLAEVVGIYSTIETCFKPTVENSNLIFEVGSNSCGITGKRVFAEDVEGELADNQHYDLKKFLMILRMSSNRECTLQFGNGIAKISIESNIGQYNYFIPASPR